MEIKPCQNFNFTFNAGLTKHMKSEMLSCNVRDIENFMHKKGINANFNDNKPIAWCSLKCIQLVDELNKKFHLNIPKPIGIFAENFSNLNGMDSCGIGATNFIPAYLYKSNNTVVPEKTIFFNLDEINWNNVNSLADIIHEQGVNTTDHFLEIFIHEFMHVFHEDNLIKKLGGQKCINFLDMFDIAEIVEIFQTKYGELLSHICEYAPAHPLETIACDLSKRFIGSINQENLQIQKNFIESSPYQKHFSLKKDCKNKTDKILRQIWIGKFTV